MALGTPKRIAGPAYIASSATNIYTPPASTIATYITQIHIANTDSSARTFSLFIGATGGSAGGTQLEGTYSVAANSDFVRYFTPCIPMISTDFLSGIASSASTLVITVLGYTVTT